MRTHKNIPLLNFYYMLAYAFEFVGKTDLINVGAESFENQQSLLATLLEAGISRQLKRGLHKDYEKRNENLTMLRGRIDMRESMQNLIRKNRELACEYDELTVDNSLNRILKTTALLLIASPNIEERAKSSLKKEMLFFSEVCIVDPRSIRWNTLRFTRSNSTYRFLISLCQLIIEGMLMSDSEGDDYLAPDLDEEQMHRIYERFILKFFQMHHPNLHASSPSIPWAVDDGYTTMLPSMYTDITLYGKERTLIIDTKYYGDNTQKNWNTEKIHSGNLYQIYAYVKNMAANEPDCDVSGMLLYAKTLAMVQPDEKYLMDGNTIYVRTLDLGVDFKAVTMQLDKIAELISMKEDLTST